MRYIWQHIQTIIDNYSGGIPLTHFLKNYFKLHPKLGSRDRKILSEMAYCWYRACKGLPENMGFEDKIKACLFICETSVPQVKQFIPAEWQYGDTLTERISELNKQGINFNVEDIVPFYTPLSAGIMYGDWRLAMLEQPRLFIRLRKNKERLLSILRKESISFRVVTDICISLPNGTAIDKLLPAEDYVVQDASSQSTGNYFSTRKNEQWWDCCSGAGGKSLLLKDTEADIRLTVSDLRSSILQNLSERFRLYGHSQPQKIVVDVADINALQAAVGTKRFDNIICDVPCTGAGTWFRTPEQLYFFKEGYIGEFSDRQRKIATNVANYLKPGGALYYITCSIFREENEDVVQFLLEHTDLRLERMELINGSNKKADCMFIAVLKK